MIRKSRKVPLSIVAEWCIQEEHPEIQGPILSVRTGGCYKLHLY